LCSVARKALHALDIKLSVVPLFLLVIHAVLVNRDSRRGNLHTSKRRVVMLMPRMDTLSPSSAWLIITLETLLRSRQYRSCRTPIISSPLYDHSDRDLRWFPRAFGAVTVISLGKFLCCRSWPRLRQVAKGENKPDCHYLKKHESLFFIALLSLPVFMIRGHSGDIHF
jgi:hypothetical protein